MRWGNRRGGGPGGSQPATVLFAPGECRHALVLLLGSGDRMNRCRGRVGCIRQRSMPSRWCRRQNLGRAVTNALAAASPGRCGELGGRSLPRRLRPPGRTRRCCPRWKRQPQRPPARGDSGVQSCGIGLKAGQSGPILLAQSVFRAEGSQENRQVTRERVSLTVLCPQGFATGLSTRNWPGIHSARPVTHHLRRPVGCQGADDRIRIRQPGAQ